MERVSPLIVDISSLLLPASQSCASSPFPSLTSHFFHFLPSHSHPSPCHRLVIHLFKVISHFCTVIAAPSSHNFRDTNSNCQNERAETCDISGNGMASYASDISRCCASGHDLSLVLVF